MVSLPVAAGNLTADPSVDVELLQASSSQPLGTEMMLGAVDSSYLWVAVDVVVVIAVDGLVQREHLAYGFVARADWVVDTSEKKWPEIEVVVWGRFPEDHLASCAVEAPQAHRSEWT